MIPVKILSAMKIFEKSSAPALERLAEAMEMQSYSAGDVLCQEGEPGKALFLIFSGSVDVLKKIDPAGSESKKVAQLGREEFFGEMAFLEQAPYSATVIAQEKTEIVCLPREEMAKLIQQDPSVVLDQILTLFSGLSARLRRTTGELVTLFEAARIVGKGLSANELLRQVLHLIQPSFGVSATLAFFVWNPFNEEYSLIVALGPNIVDFPPLIDKKDSFFNQVGTKFKSIPDISGFPPNLSPFSFSKGHLLISPIERTDHREGLLVGWNENPGFFDPKHFQLIETISAVLAPALTNARDREEESARLRLQRSRQESFGL